MHIVVSDAPESPTLMYPFQPFCFVFWYILFFAKSMSVSSTSQVIAMSDAVSSAAAFTRAAKMRRANEALILKCHGVGLTPRLTKPATKEEQELYRLFLQVVITRTTIPTILVMNR